MEINREDPWRHAHRLEDSPATKGELEALRARVAALEAVLTEYLLKKDFEQSDCFAQNKDYQRWIQQITPPEEPSA